MSHFSTDVAQQFYLAQNLEYNVYNGDHYYRPQTGVHITHVNCQFPGGDK